VTPRAQVVFLVNLLQDVNIIRPLLHLIAAELDVPQVLAVTDKFIERDKNGIWGAELREISQATGAAISVYDSAWTAYQLLQDRCGVIVAASESNLGAHLHTHDVFRAAPASYLKLTLQHGYECVGFLQNREHVLAHGHNVSFAADVICGWSEPSMLTSVVATERAKLCVTGPSTLIEIDGGPAPARTTTAAGLVCENLHSVRLNVGSDTKSSFLGSFGEFCRHLEQRGESVVMKPHPGGQYVVKNRVELPPNVELNNNPIYKIDLGGFGYGISAPSSIVIDLAIAGVPVAVWRDQDGRMDTSNFSGLAFIQETRDWIAFKRDTDLRRAAILERQRAFLQSTRLLIEPKEIRRRFLSLIGNGLSAMANARRSRRPLTQAHSQIA